MPLHGMCPAPVVMQGTACPGQGGSPALGCPISHLQGLGGSLASSPDPRKEISQEAAIAWGCWAGRAPVWAPQPLSPSFACTEGSSALAVVTPHVPWLFCCLLNPSRQAAALWFRFGAPQPRCEAGVCVFSVPREQH